MPTLPEILDWWATLDPVWQFLFALPFAVAGAGLLAGWVESRRAHERGEAERS